MTTFQNKFDIANSNTYVISLSNYILQYFYRCFRQKNSRNNWERNIPKLFNAGHFDHFLSFLTLAPALCPTGSSRIQTDCRSTAGLCSTPSMSWYQISIFSILQYFIILIFRHFKNFRIQPICNLITGFAQLHRLPLPSLADVDSNPLPRHHLPRLRHQRWWQCGGKGNQQHYSWNGYWTSPTNR